MKTNEIQKLCTHKGLGIWLALLMLSLFQMPTQSLATGGDMIGNGGGAARNGVIMAYNDLQKSVRMCLSSPVCRINAAEKAALQSIYSGLRSGHRSEIRFVSERAHPGTFLIDGEVKMAKTGSKPNSPIYVNNDFLVTRDQMGRDVIFSYNDATALMVHEVGHHYTKISHESLDLLGAKVAQFMSRNTIEAPLLPNVDQIKVFAINPADNENEFPELYLTAFNDFVDFTAHLRQRAICPHLRIPLPIGRIPDISLSHSKPSGASVSNLHWSRVRSRSGGRKVLLEITGNLQLHCPARVPLSRTDRDYQVRIDLELEVYGENKGRIQPDSVRISQRSNPWWKIITLPFF